MNDEKEDENPWDEEDAGRTLATASPSFDSNVPSPITVPPPPPIETSPTIPRAFTAGAAGAVRPMNPANKPMPKATLVGLNPADFIKSLPRAGSQPQVNAPRGAVAAVAPRFPTPTPAPASASRSSNAPNSPEVDEDDSPTMLGVRAPRELLGDSDLPTALPAALADAQHDKFAETMALEVDDDLLPDLAPLEDIDEATKVGARAQELHRRQDAHVIVGQGAVGDEATLAIPPSADLGYLPDPSTLGPPLPPQTPPQPPVSQHYPPQTPRSPGAPGFAPPVNALEQTQMAHEPYPQPPPAWQQQPQPPPPWPPPMPPHPPQSPYGQPPSNPAIPVSQPFPPQGWGPQPGMTPYAMGPQPPPAPAPAPASGLQPTRQVMLLAGVGVICLAIFIIGVVLFITTKP